MKPEEALERVETLRRNSIDLRSEEALRIVLAMAKAAQGMAEALGRMETDITNITGTPAQDFVPHMERVDVDGQVLESLLGALAAFRKASGG